MTSLAQAKKLFVMEALWTRWIPSYRYVVDVIKSGAIGDVYYVSANLGFKDLTANERIAKKELGGGTILDIGVYAINIVEMAYNDEVPLNISAVGSLNSDGVDVSMSASLLFRSGKTAQIATHAIVDLPKGDYIVGTNGTIRINSFENIYVNGVLHEFPFPVVNDPLFYGHFGSLGFRYEINEVRQCLLAGKLESSILSHNVSLNIANIEDELRRQIGVKYDVD